MQGVYTALITPFRRDGSIDFRSLEKVIAQQIDAGIRGFVVSGTTGESPTLSVDEKAELFQWLFDILKGKAVDLVAGTGTYDTRESIALTKKAESIGYRKFLIVVPYYNKPSQSGLRAHFEAIANAVSDGIVVLYNVPSRTGISLTSDTIVELAAHPRIRAIKDASGDLVFLAELRSRLRKAGRELDLFSGDDITYAEFLLGGGNGVISVASHVCPRAMIEIETAVREGNRAKLERLDGDYGPLFRELFRESNPVPLKWMLAKLGFIENTFRLPLVPAGADTVEKLETIFREYHVEAGELRR